MQKWLIRIVSVVLLWVVNESSVFAISIIVTAEVDDPVPENSVFTVYGTATYSIGFPVSGAAVTITVNGSEYTCYTSSGNYIKEVSGLSAGIYTATVYVTDSSVSGTGTVIFEVESSGGIATINATIDTPVYAGDDFIVYGTAEYEMGSGLTLPMMGAYVTAAVNGSIYDAHTITDGTYSITAAGISYGTYTAKVEVTDASVSADTYVVFDVVYPPISNIVLSSTTCAENAGSNTLVGVFSLSGGSGINSYNMVPGTGGDDNDSFSISGSNLYITINPDYETQSNYTIRLLISSMYSGSTQMVFSIQILDDPDEDGDGLADLWEQGIVDADPEDGITSIEDVSSDDDFDGDGCSNYQEMVAGTQATEVTDVFAVTSIAVSESSGSVGWTTVTGRYYSVYSSTDLTSAVWFTNLYRVPGTEDGMSFSLPVGAGINYRIGVSAE